MVELRPSPRSRIRLLSGTLAVLLFASGATTFAETLPATIQVTPSEDGRSESWVARNSPTSGGKILFVSNDGGVRYYDGASLTVLQNGAAGDRGNAGTVALGTDFLGKDVVGLWGGGGGPLWVSLNRDVPSQLTLNTEEVAIADGCVFLVVQSGGKGKHVIQFMPGTRATQQVSSGSFEAGVNRLVTSRCRAAWTFCPTNANSMSLAFWNGIETIVDTEIDSLPSFVDGKLVYTKTVSGVQQVFLIDTAASLTPLQVSNETDPGVRLDSPQTDGRHVVWYRYVPTDGSNAQLVVRGDLVFPTAPLRKLHELESAFQLHRGQLLWKTAGGSFEYDNGVQQFRLDVSPARSGTLKLPWLADGYIAFLGTPAGATDDEVFRVTASTPLADPQPPLVVAPVPGSNVVRFDEVIGATSYNAYVAYEPGVTKDNYASLTGGRKIENVTSGFSIPAIPRNTTYFVSITAVENAIEGPSSRFGSTTLVAATPWQPIYTNWPFYSVAADPTNDRYVYAGSRGAVLKSWNRGLTFEQVLPTVITGASRIRALATRDLRSYLATDTGDIWLAEIAGSGWSKTHDGSSSSAYGGLIIDPANPSVIYAGNFETFSPSTESRVIQSADAGVTWMHTGPGPSLPDQMGAQALAAAATTPVTIYAGGDGTPNVAKTVDGGATWLSAEIPGAGEVRSLAVDPTSPTIIYASTRDKGVFKSMDGGMTWSAKNNGLHGVSTEPFGGAEFNAIVVDPQDPNLIHLGAGNGYWLSLDGGDNWVSANDGFPTTPWIYGLEMAPTRWLYAATEGGLYFKSFAPPPVIAAIDPPQGNVWGHTWVTIRGMGFQPNAGVYFGSPGAWSGVQSPTEIWAATPGQPGQPGSVDVRVKNPDGQEATLAGGFTYTDLPDTPKIRAEAISGTSIEVSVELVSGAASYVVERRAPTEDFQPIATLQYPYLEFIDPVAADTSYLYRVQTVNSSGTSGYGVDLATAMVFSDGILPGLPVKAIHLAETRLAIGHVRALAGLGSVAYTDPATHGITIKAVHISEMRNALDEALAVLGLASGGYTEGGNLAGALIKAQHFEEIRRKTQ